MPVGPSDEFTTLKPERLPLWGRKILVVEDNYLVADYVRRLLVDAGATVIGPVPTESRSLAMTADGVDLDAGILDVRLGEQTSVNVARRLSERGVPFVVVSGYGSEALPPELKNAPYLAKPIKSADLVPMIVRLFRSAA